MNNKSDTLDLHGRTTDEVIDLIDSFIHEKSKKGKKQVKIMPGKGTGKVRSEVIRYLKMGGFPWQYEKMSNGKANEGVIVVFLD
jgi:dsDNA-specific endonuclease/ATPase MutS2